MSRYTQAKSRRTATQERKARLDRAGAALIAACLLGFAAMGYGAYKGDQARGITVDQSLKAWGL